MNKRFPGLLLIASGLCFLIVALFFADRPGAFVAIGSALVAVGAALLGRAKARANAVAKAPDESRKP